jgi:phage terminase large subunit-like protein
VARKTNSTATAKKRHKPTKDHARNYSQIAFEYATAAVADKKGKKFCKWVRLAAKRHLDDLKKKSKSWRYYFDEWHANDVCDFAEKMPHIEGSWKSKSITLEPAQIFILVVVFGWRRKSDGNRRFSRVYIEMARKNAKSTLSAIVALYCLTCEGEVGPQIIIGATTGEQAKKVFGPAWQITRRTEELCEAFGLESWGSAQYPKSITCGQNGGFIQPINSKSSTQDGWNPHVGILDELHAHKDRGLYDVIKSAFGARKNPLMWCITTAGYIINGVCYEQRKLVTQILQGVIEAEHYFGIIYTLDEGDDELDPAVWIKSNPLLGVSVQLEEMIGYSKEAIASPESMSEFKTKRLNIWTTAKNGWLNIEQWKKCGGPIILKHLEKLPAYGGLDLASTSDIAAYVLLWEQDAIWKFWCKFYLPEDAVWPRTEKGNVPYQVWADQGYLTVTPGNVIDYDYIEKDIEESMDKFDIKEIGFDNWNAVQTVSHLIDKGAPMVEVRQGPKSFHPAMQAFERRVKNKTLHHGDNPVLTWMASNIVARRDVNDNMAPDKKNSMEKIDGMVAALMAVARMISNTEKASVYESRGILEIEV